jgi:hypothetical protein
MAIGAFAAALPMVMTIDLIGDRALLWALLAPAVAIPVALFRRLGVRAAMVAGAGSVLTSFPMMVPALFVAFFLALIVLPVVALVLLLFGVDSGYAP